MIGNIDRVRTLTPVAPDRQGAASLVQEASLSILAFDAEAVRLSGAGLEPGTPVFISFTRRDTYQGIVMAAAALRRCGLEPVPHVAARYLSSVTQLNDFLARAAGEAGVDRVMLIAGDIESPSGPFHSSLQLMMTGTLERHGISRIEVAGYPEPHPRIGEKALTAALQAKESLARARGLEMRILTQFCFEAAPILGWVRRMREFGIAAPIRVGLAGPASVAALAKFAVRYGIGHSICALARGHSSIARILAEIGPEDLVRTLELERDDGADIAGLHLYSFGGFARTAECLHRMRVAEHEPEIRGFGL